MDREAWRATAHGVARVRHDRATNTQREKGAARGRRVTEGFSEEVTPELGRNYRVSSLPGNQSQTECARRRHEIVPSFPVIYKC